MPQHNQAKKESCHWSPSKTQRGSWGHEEAVHVWSLATPVQVAFFCGLKTDTVLLPTLTSLFGGVLSLDDWARGLTRAYLSILHFAQDCLV